MDANEIIEKLNSHISWLDGLKSMEDKQFFAPIATGKWSVAAMVTHFKYWDQIVLDKRLSQTTKKFESLDTEDINKQAEAYAHSGVSKIQLIDEVIQTRKNFVQALKDLPEEAWNSDIKIGNHSILFKTYMSELAEHDEHHQNQI